MGLLTYTDGVKVLRVDFDNTANVKCDTILRSIMTLAWLADQLHATVPLAKATFNRVGVGPPPTWTFQIRAVDGRLVTQAVTLTNPMTYTYKTSSNTEWQVAELDMYQRLHNHIDDMIGLFQITYVRITWS